MKIDTFDGKHAWLSNFYPAPVVLDRVFPCPSVEHAYQAAKTLRIGQRLKIIEAPSAAIAKRLGKTVIMRPDWDSVWKLPTMEDLVRQKFTFDQRLSNLLLETGSVDLIEGNWWGDTYWGVCKGVGKNNLGKILMRVRKELRNVGRLGMIDIMLYQSTGIVGGGLDP